jgi:hypothetical protein
MKISEHFSLQELVRTSTGLKNEPSPTAKVSLIMLVQNVLEPARLSFGKPIKVTSGFRSPSVNKAIGGATNSQHSKGEAADLFCEDNAKLFEIIRNELVFDQLIWEGGTKLQPAWVHVSYKTQGNRSEVLRMVKENGKTKYIKL